MTDDSALDRFIKENKEDKDIIKKVIVTFIPSMKQLFRVLRNNKIFIDTQDSSLKSIIRKAYQLKHEEEFGVEDRLSYFSLSNTVDNSLEIAQMDKEIQELKSRPYVGTRVYCEDLEYGEGTVISLNSGNLMLVKFDNRELNTMCDYVKMITVHDDIKRKLVAI